MFQSIRFKYKYKSFTALFKDADRLRAFYKSYGLAMDYDIYPLTLEASYEVTQER